MDDRNNTIAGWVLAGGIAALGLSILSGKYFHADHPEAPKEQGYAIEGVESSGGGDAAEVPLATLLAAADPAKGEKVFAKCAACHSINKGGSNGVGPNLWGTFGKPHGHVAGFAYSDALKGVAGNWDFEGMNAWLKSPRNYANGTKMTFAGLSKPEDRANILVYLNQQSDSPMPLPAAPVAEAEPAAEAPAEGAEAPAEGEAAAAEAPAES
ncbi:MAG: cytochrome c family protein [Blastomonas sp.]